MQVVYDKDGNAHSREPVDAREMIASGHYFASNPTKPAPVSTAGAPASNETAAAGNSGDGGSDTSSASGLKPFDEITVAEIKGQLDAKNVPIPDGTRKKQDLYDLLKAHQ